ncbi:alanine--glyoxylate aminotransferase 2 like protein 3 [Quercus suber]|uniref:Alanine--glyoxylate aminotransferase 2 like protein 3 n=1 Tax=Quercus suber TaxID=58331 RepID=A0AAW0LSX0_QUESU
MQGILTRKVFSGRISLCSQPRCFSQLAQKNASLQENDVTVPKMPPFDYSPPPYNGPTVDEIMAKRQAYLISASLFHLYKKL